MANGDQRWNKANREKTRAADKRWREAHPDQSEANRLRTYVNQLMRGDQIAHWGHHHQAMAEINGPRPAGLELSLVHPDSLDAYDGYAIKRGERYAYRLSTNPDDYAWETRAENEARKGPR